MRRDFREYDADAICKMADPEVIAECLGLETRRKGRRTSILCPDHNDHHFFSCYLTEQGYHCFSCGGHGSVIALVRKVNNVSFREACSFICDILGDKDGFWQDSAAQHQKHVLSDEDLRLIGLKPRKTSDGQPRPGAGIYKSIAIFDDREDVDLQKGQKLEKNFLLISDVDCSFEEPVQANDGYYVLKECIDHDPLRSLLQTDEESYSELIRQKAEEAKERYSQMVEMAKNPARFYSDSNPDAFLIAYYCHKVAHRVGLQKWTSEMNRLIRRCEDICINFGGTAKEPLKEEKRRSIFGKIHA
jgi:hypothetical protein